MMDGSKRVQATRELIFKKKIVDALWKALYEGKGLLPRSSYKRSGCKKCDNEQDHSLHLSPVEKEGDEIATKYLKKFEGFFDQK
jgi:hypothetical protein